jgi:C1A family cysteine protease
MIYTLGVALVLAASVSASVSRTDPTQLKAMWESFKREFGRSYSTMDEETNRFQIFVQNLKAAEQRQKDELASGGNAVHGITKFFDLSQAEFESRYLTADPKLKSSERVLDSEARTVDTTAALVDWTGKLTTAVKDQGYCGSCWAFSATEQIESDAIRTLGKTYLLSAEQITQCDKTSYGCNGGWTENAYTYVKNAGGIETEANYPYTSYQGVTGTCKSDSSKFVVKVTGYKTLASESAMASYVQGTGPLSVCVDASTWNSYSGGIVKTCGKSVNHCVQAVGVDTAAGYWKVRNSWGTSWGESGFIRLSYGSNTCAIASDPTYATVA